MIDPRLGAAPVVLVAAVARNGAIGRQGRLIWRLSSDLRRFKAVTMGKPVIMGRKTWESIGRPLPGRTVIVVTRQADFSAPGIIVAEGLGSAIAIAKEEARTLAADEIIVAGGGEVYRQAMPLAQRLRITEVDLTPDADAFFPTIDPAVWRETSREVRIPGVGDETAYAFVDYERRAD